MAGAALVLLVLAVTCNSLLLIFLLSSRSAPAAPAPAPAPDAGRAPAAPVAGLPVVRLPAADIVARLTAALPRGAPLWRALEPHLESVDVPAVLWKAAVRTGVKKALTTAGVTLSPLAGVVLSACVGHNALYSFLSHLAPSPPNLSHVLASTFFFSHSAPEPAPTPAPAPAPAAAEQRLPRAAAGRTRRSADNPGVAPEEGVLESAARLMGSVRLPPAPGWLRDGVAGARVALETHAAPLVSTDVKANIGRRLDTFSAKRVFQSATQQAKNVRVPPTPAWLLGGVASMRVAWDTHAAALVPEAVKSQLELRGAPNFLHACDDNEESAMCDALTSLSAKVQSSVYFAELRKRISGGTVAKSDDHAKESTRGHAHIEEPRILRKKTSKFFGRLMHIEAETVLGRAWLIFQSMLFAGAALVAAGFLFPVDNIWIAFAPLYIQIFSLYCARLYKRCLVFVSHSWRVGRFGLALALVAVSDTMSSIRLLVEGVVSNGEGLLARLRHRYPVVASAADVAVPYILAAQQHIFVHVTHVYETCKVQAEACLCYLVNRFRPGKAFARKVFSKLLDRTSSYRAGFQASRFCGWIRRSHVHLLTLSQNAFLQVAAVSSRAKTADFWTIARDVNCWFGSLLVSTAKTAGPFLSSISCATKRNLVLSALMCNTIAAFFVRLVLDPLFQTEGYSLLRETPFDADCGLEEIFCQHPYLPCMHTPFILSLRKAGLLFLCLWKSTRCFFEDCRLIAHSITLRCAHLLLYPLFHTAEFQADVEFAVLEAVKCWRATSAEVSRRIRERREQFSLMLAAFANG